MSYNSVIASARLPQSVSLDIAVDHRIRKFFRPVPRPHDEPSRSTHVSLIKKRGRYLRVKDDEIRVTSQLAGPALTGGIAVVLQQPRLNHPFENGVESVIEDCETFTTLRELFATASCHTLDILPDISIIDLLPYIPQRDMKKIDDEEMRDAFWRTLELFLTKKPAVVFCAGQLRLDSRDHCKGDMRKLESIGIAGTFDNSFVKVCGRNREPVEFRRVNGFHPSTAMNYFPEYSCLRQLLLLEVAQTCALLSGNWEEEAWMSEFRTSCKDSFSQRIYEEKSLLDYVALYTEKLNDIQESISTLATSPAIAPSVMANGLYHVLVESRLSEHCNDASLILRTLSELVDGTPPQWVDNRREKDLMAAQGTSLLARHRWGFQGWFDSTRLGLTILDHMKLLGECTNSNSRKPSLDLMQGSIVFIRMAEAVEAILWGLIQDKSDSGTEVEIHEREVIVIQD